MRVCKLDKRSECRMSERKRSARSWSVESEMSICRKRKCLLSWSHSWETSAQVSNVHLSESLYKMRRISLISSRGTLTRLRVESELFS